MPNTFLTVGMITRETAIVLENECTFTAHVDRTYEKQLEDADPKIGYVVNVRLPVRSINTTGQGLVLQDLTETSVPVALTTQYQRSFAVTSSDYSQDIDNFRRRFIRPHVISMANQIDHDGMALAFQVANQVGTPGTPPATLQTYLDATALLDNQATPMDDRTLVISPTMQSTIVNALNGQFNPQAQISSQYKKGRMASFTAGLDWYMDQNCNSHTVGPLGGSPVANSGTVQTGASIITNGWTSSAANRLKAGDVITFGTLGSSNAVLGVNPQNRDTYGKLLQFVVTADVSSDSGGNATIPISPAIITTGAFQNVNQGVVNSAPVTVSGAAGVQSQYGVAFHKSAFTFVCAPLPLYGGLDMADRITNELDISTRVIRDYDINLDRAPLRIDVLGGWATIYPQCAVRIAS